MKETRSACPGEPPSPSRAPLLRRAAAAPRRCLRPCEPPPSPPASLPRHSLRGSSPTPRALLPRRLAAHAFVCGRRLLPSGAARAPPCCARAACSAAPAPLPAPLPASRPTPRQRQPHQRRGGAPVLQCRRCHPAPLSCRVDTLDASCLASSAPPGSSSTPRVHRSPGRPTRPAMRVAPPPPRAPPLRCAAVHVLVCCRQLRRSTSGLRSPASSASIIHFTPACRQRHVAQLRARHCPPHLLCDQLAAKRGAPCAADTPRLCHPAPLRSSQRVAAVTTRATATSRRWSRRRRHARRRRAASLRVLSCRRLHLVRYCRAALLRMSSCAASSSRAAPAPPCCARAACPAAPAPVPVPVPARTNFTEKERCTSRCAAVATPRAPAAPAAALRRCARPRVPPPSPHARPAALSCCACPRALVCHCRATPSLGRLSSGLPSLKVPRPTARPEQLSVLAQRHAVAGSCRCTCCPSARKANVRCLLAGTITRNTPTYVAPRAVGADVASPVTDADVTVAAATNVARPLLPLPSPIRCRRWPRCGRCAATSRPPSPLPPPPPVPASPVWSSGAPGSCPHCRLRASHPCRQLSSPPQSPALAALARSLRPLDPVGPPPAPWAARQPEGAPASLPLVLASCSWVPPAPESRSWASRAP